MPKKLLSILLSTAMVAAILTGCSSTLEETLEEIPPVEEELLPEEVVKNKVGISMPTKDIQRWNQDGASMQKELEAAGYKVNLQYAGDDEAQQMSQIENMISDGVNVLIIAAIEASSLGKALDMAKASNIPVIAYDRLLMDSEAVSYYVAFDDYKVGVTQGQYIVDTLDIKNTDGPYNLEITAGDPDDGSASFFYNGAMDILKPYIESGKLVVKSGQSTFEEASTPKWDTKTARDRAESILSSHYADGTSVDVWLCSNDSTALGVINALTSGYVGEYPIVTGQDCDVENIKNMIEGRQAMSVFKDTRILVSQVVKMAGQILSDEKVDVNDTETYDNGTGVIPSFLCDPVFADANNYEEILSDSGYYTEDQLE